MPGCAAVGCSNSAKKGYLMKRFPKDPKLRNEWVSKVKRDKWIPTDHSCLCEIHFEAHMWEKTREDGTRKLKRNSVPTLFIISTKKSTRKPPAVRQIQNRTKLPKQHQNITPVVDLDNNTSTSIPTTNQTIFNLGIPLRIFSDCEETVCAFSKIKHSSLESSRRLEACIKGAGPPLYTDGAHVTDNSEQLNTKPEKIEEIFIKEEPMEQTSLHTDGPSVNIQPHTHSALPNSTTQLQRVSAEPQNQLHKDVVSHNIQLDTDTNYYIEQIFIKEEPLEETPQDRELCDYLIQDIVKEECNTKDESATLNTSDEV